MDKKSGLYAIFDQLSVVAICLFALECVLGCSGQWLSFGPISIRMVLFAICFVLTLPNVFRNLKELLRTHHVIWAVLLGIYLVIAAVIGWRNGNSLSFIKADLTGHMSFALLPGILATFCTRERVAKLMNVVFWGSVVLGAITVILHFYFAFARVSQIMVLNDWLNDHYMGGLATMATGIQRTYFRSHIFLQVGLLIGLQKVWCKTGRDRWFLFGAEAILAYGCLMTYTRGFWLGLAISAICLLALYPQQWKRYLSGVGFIALLLAVLFTLSGLAYGKPVAAVEVVNRFNPNLFTNAIFLPNDDTLDGTDGTEETDPTDSDADQLAVQIRQESLRLLGEKISQKPIFGNGLGTNLDEIRDDGKVEYMYYDVIMKTGLVGFLIFCGAFFLPIGGMLKRRTKWLVQKKEIPWDSQEMQNTTLLAAFLGVAITSYLNPFLSNPMGILLVMLLSAANQSENISFKEKET